MRLLLIGLSMGLTVGLGAGGVLAAGSVERGDYLVNSIMGCGNCHTPIGPQGFEQDKALSGRLVERSGFHGDCGQHHACRSHQGLVG